MQENYNLDWTESTGTLKWNCISLGWLTLIAGKTSRHIIHHTQTEHNTAFQQHTTCIAMDSSTTEKQQQKPQINQAVTNTSSCAEQIYNQNKRSTNVQQKRPSVQIK